MKITINKPKYQKAQKLSPAVRNSTKTKYLETLKKLFKADKEFKDIQLRESNKYKLLLNTSNKESTSVYFGETKSFRGEIKAHGNGMFIEYRKEDFEKEKFDAEPKSYSYGIFEVGEANNIKTLNTSKELETENKKEQSLSPIKGNSISQAHVKTSPKSLKEKDITIKKASEFFNRYYYATTHQLPMKLWIWNIITNSNNKEEISKSIEESEGDQEVKLSRDLNVKKVVKKDQLNRAIKFLEKAINKINELNHHTITYSGEVSLTAATGVYYYAVKPDRELSSDDITAVSRKKLASRVAFNAYCTLSKMKESLEEAKKNLKTISPIKLAKPDHNPV